MRVGVCILGGMFLLAMAARALERKAIRVKEGDFSKEQLVKLAKKALKDSGNSFTVVNFYGNGGGTAVA